MKLSEMSSLEKAFSFTTAWLIVCVIGITATSMVSAHEGANLRAELATTKIGLTNTKAELVSTRVVLTAAAELAKNGGWITVTRIPEEDGWHAQTCIQVNYRDKHRPTARFVIFPDGTYDSSEWDSKGPIGRTTRFKPVIIEDK
jgi:hypothetical protein